MTCRQAAINSVVTDTLSPGQKREYTPYWNYLLCIKDSRKKESTKQLCKNTYFLSSYSYATGKIVPQQDPTWGPKQRSACHALPLLNPSLALPHFLGLRTNLSSSPLPPAETLLLPPATIMPNPNPHSCLLPLRTVSAWGTAKGRRLLCMQITRMIPLGSVPCLPAAYSCLTTW